LSTPISKFTGDEEVEDELSDIDLDAKDINLQPTDRLSVGQNFGGSK
tara:strand:- start:429 stop:569 length:141 start_codon:yes stop_codon:yes gene_type:complete